MVSGSANSVSFNAYTTAPASDFAAQSVSVYASAFSVFLSGVLGNWIVKLPSADLISTHADGSGAKVTLGNTRAVGSFTSPDRSNDLSSFVSNTILGFLSVRV